MCGIFSIIRLVATQPKKYVYYNYFENIKNRGPDSSVFHDKNHFILGFHRRILNDTSSQGDQPFIIEEKKGDLLRKIYVMCNGEIYNHKELKAKYNIPIKSYSDCECISYIYKNYGIKVLLDNINRSEFAFVILDVEYSSINDIKSIRIFAAVDPYGVKPLFTNFDCKVFEENKIQDLSPYIAFSSLLKGLVNYENSPHVRIKPGHYININIVTESINNNKVTELINDNKVNDKVNDDNNKINNKLRYKIESAKEVQYFSHKVRLSTQFNLKDIQSTIVAKLSSAVISRLHSNRVLGNMKIADYNNIGVFLSGGLDSSLVAAIAQNEIRRITDFKSSIKTYSIGFEQSPDLAAAKLVADHIGSIHTEYKITALDCILAIPDVIKAIESYDITSIRASLPQYLMCKKVSENKDQIIILSGEGADEVCFGYMLFHLAPNEIEANKESIRLVNNIHKYDVTRAERTTSDCGLEIRVPFLDSNFVEYYNTIDSKYKMPMKTKDMECMRNIENKDGKRVEKGLLREAFYPVLYNYNKKSVPCLPLEILTRKKDAFSDAISGNKLLCEYIKEFCETIITDKEYQEYSVNYKINMPLTKESYYYMKLYEKTFGKNQWHIIPENWKHTFSNQSDPSARLLTEFKNI